jgi:hypothetical protein
MSGERQLRQVGEIVLGVAHLIGVAQRGAKQPLAVGLKRDLPLALGQHKAPKRHHGLLAHGLADHRKGLLGYRLVGSDIIGSVEEALVDLLAWHKTVDLDHVGALDL